MRAVLAGIVAISLSFICSAADWPRQETPYKDGDYCIDDSIFFVKMRLGEEVQIEDSWMVKDGPGSEYPNGRFTVYVTTNACQGYFMFRPKNWVRPEECKRPQYLQNFPEREQMIHMAGGSEECEKHVKNGMEFPELDYSQLPTRRKSP
jgi:hypothetical protein